MLPARVIEVTAGLIERDGKILTAQRPEEKYKGLWEFPGGKIEQGESARSCLQRELKEELGIDTCIGELFLESEWRREEDVILLRTFMVADFTGKLQKNVHSQLLWQKPSDMDRNSFLPADRPVVDKLVSEGFFS